MSDPAKDIVDTIIEHLGDKDCLEFEGDEEETAAVIESLYPLVRQHIPKAPAAGEADGLPGWIDTLTAKGGVAEFSRIKKDVSCSIQLNNITASGKADTTFGAIVRARDAIRAELSKLRETEL